MATIKKPVVEYNSRGPSGNIYAILGMVQTALRKQRRYTDYNNLRDRVFESHSYQEALDIISETVTLKDTAK